MAAVMAHCDDLQRGLPYILETLEAFEENALASTCASLVSGAYDPGNSHGHTMLSALLAADLPVRLAESLNFLEFESQKLAVRVFECIQRCAIKIRKVPTVVSYVRDRLYMVEWLLDGCARQDVSLHCNMMLQSLCSPSQDLAQMILNAQGTARLMRLLQHESFEIAADAYATLRFLLLSHKQLSAAYVEMNFDQFFAQFNELLQSPNYVTQRQTLKLLGEMLLDSFFTNAMSIYSRQALFLRIHMVLLLSSSEFIQLHAFHIFKLFVANPHKPFRTEQILRRNKNQLVGLLQSFLPSLAEDETFSQDLRTVLDMLHDLSPLLKGHRACTPAPGEDATRFLRSNTKRCTSMEDTWDRLACICSY